VPVGSANRCALCLWLGDTQRRRVLGERELADRRVRAERLGGGTAGLGGGTLEQTRVDLRADKVRRQCQPRNCSAMAAIEPSWSRAAAITGTARRAASSMPVIPAACTASSPPTDARMMPSAAVATVNSRARSARARPASDSRTCSASASNGCGPSTSVRSAATRLSMTAWRT
jgi:hypothetical protein